MSNYTIYHLHSDLSNPTTTIDSATKYYDYIKVAKELGMKALGFSEHGSIFEWYHKKTTIEKAGMKYIHGTELYVTKSLDEKVRDNYHIILIAKNFEGFKELNKLVTIANTRTDSHFYYNPRITFQELYDTTDNILFTSSCLGGVLNTESDLFNQQMLDFFIQNRHRCWLEIQHHNVDEQISHNKKVYNLSVKYNIPLITGTDTHSLNKELAEARLILQKAKNIHFANEDAWDTVFKTYEELVACYEVQKSLPMDIILEAIENTNKLADMIEPFTLDKSPKYPKLYEDSEAEFKRRVNHAYKNHKYAKNYDVQVIKDRVQEELEVYKKTNTIDYMVFQHYLREWERENGIFCGYARGSVSGSMIAYLLGVTEMDSIKFNLNFFRFLNPHRVTLCDIDTDYSNADREKLKHFLFSHKNMYLAEIITFNTIAKKGAIRDVARALEIDLAKVNEICENIDTKEQEYRKEYPEMFKYVDLLQGVIVSIGTHPAGVCVSPIDLAENVGLCSLSTTEYPVTCLNMKELEDLMFVKLDLLGLDNVGVINETCKLVGIERLTPDNTDLEDMEVWRSIRDDTTCIFQWESESAQAYLKRLLSDKTIDTIKSKIPNLKMMKLFSFGNGLIRPACASYRDSVANGEFYDNGLEELNMFLADEMGRLTMQETIMNFLVKFCGYSMAESDSVRRAIAKKYGTEQLLPEIRQRFIEYTSSNYDIDKSKCEEIIEPFIQVILDASAYGFSWNHSDAYSCIGYICGYLRYYYPLEFITVSLNIFKDNEEKRINILQYANKNNMQVFPIKFGKSSAMYTMDKETNSIYEGISSVKFCNVQMGEELYEIAKNKYTHFLDLLIDVKSWNTKQRDILVKLNFFDMFGKNGKLLKFLEYFDLFYEAKQIKIDKYNALGLSEDLIKDCCKATAKIYKEIDWKLLLYRIWDTIEDKNIPINEQMQYELEYVGYIKTKLPNISDNYKVITEINKKFKHPILSLYRLNDGGIERIKMKEHIYDENNPKVWDVIKVIDIAEEGKWQKLEDGRWTQSKTEKEKFIKRFAFINT